MLAAATQRNKNILLARESLRDSCTRAISRERRQELGASEPAVFVPWSMGLLFYITS